MTHFEIYSSARQRVILITLFFIFLGISQFLVDVFLEDSPNFNAAVLRLAFYGILGHQLLAGQKWAVTVTSLLSALTIALILFSFIGPSDLDNIISRIFLIAAYGFIIWSLTTDSTYQSYSELKAQGFDPGGKEVVLFNALTNGTPVHRIPIHEVNTIEAYTLLSKELLQKAGLYDHIESIKADEANKKITIETADTLFEIPVNDRLKIMDKGFVDRINAIVQALGSTHSFRYVYPDGILQPDGINHFLVFGDDSFVDKLRRYGYARKGD